MNIRVLYLIQALLLSSNLAAEKGKYLIEVHLFKAGPAEGLASVQKAEILTTFDRPGLSGLKNMATDNDIEFTAAVIVGLMDLYGLSAIDDLFLCEKRWNGLGKPFIGDMILGGQESYRIDLSPKRLPSLQIGLHLGISMIAQKPKGLFRGDQILIHQDLLLDLGDPVIVVAPYRDQNYFAMILVKSVDTSDARPKAEAMQKSKQIQLQVPPRPINRVAASYPEALRRRLFGGQIELKVTINEKGVVLGVEVVKPLHPYLNYATVQALRKWTFEPVQHYGKAVSAIFGYSYEFDPMHNTGRQSEQPASNADSESPWRDQMAPLLKGCGDYCRMIAAAILDFICEENIKEIHFDLMKDVNWMIGVVGPKRVVASQDQPSRDPVVGIGAANDGALSDPRVVEVLQIMDPRRTKRSALLCDYQIIRKGETFSERRIILKENGQIPKGQKFLDERRFSGLSSLFAPLRVLGEEHQPKYNFRILDKDNIGPRKVYVLEALPKSGDEDGIWSARIWVDIQSFQILKCEIEGVPVDGYEDVLNDCVALNIKPIFTTLHEYRYEKNGVLFPSKTKIRVAYPGIIPHPIPKDEINMAYDKYRFFIVKTESELIK